ncbi:hypothetical protein GIB67_034660 [Kingdonia uniflora]|uniref:ATP synthase alpha subunit C-terminal domain-containing protein n=1 Tax=Kingdonia uniflora TaxID=39325 RepID=A0A7J7P0V2_9MAGN|nr:hypothetical protein GIB67_034660 [Kingdonia uniflora]
MGNGLMIQEGSFVKATGRITQIPMSESYLGRVLNALAKPIYGRGAISASESQLIESPTPCIIARRSIYEPLQTGLIVIDSLIHIGRAIGQKASSVAQVVTTFQERGAMEYTIVIAEVAEAPARLQYLAPYTRAALAEYFMYQLEAFGQFASDLDKATHNQLARGQRLRELLKQSQPSPLSVDEQIVTIYTRTNKYLDSLEVSQVNKFLSQLRTYLKMNKPQFQEIISSTKRFTEEVEILLKEAIEKQIERFLLHE